MVVHNLLPAIPRSTPTLALRVRARDVVADGVVSLTLDHPYGVRLPDWAPGAHIDLVLPNGTTRQYSLCGDRWDPYSYRIAVLREPAGRGGSVYVHDRLMPGDRVGVGGAHNHFPLVPADRYLFIAGGIGITPLLPMIHQAEVIHADRQLLYGGRTRASMAFRADLTHAYGERVQISPQDEYGLLDLAGWLREPLPGTKVYCCGPAPFLAAVEEACAHWPEHSLRTERFTAADGSEPVRRTPFEVELRRTGRTVTVNPDVSVLHAVRGAGADCHQHRGCLRKRAEEEAVTEVPEPPSMLLPPAELPRTQIIERTRHRYEDIHHLLEKRWTISAIARRLNLDRKTVRRFLDTALDELLASARERRPNGVLDPFKAYLNARFTEAQGQASGTQLFLEIQARGYRGSRQVVRKHLAALRAGTAEPVRAECPGPARAPDHAGAR